MRLPTLKELVTEKSRYAKEKGERYSSPEQEIDQVFQQAQSQGSQLFAQYAAVPKLGINPSTAYGTPLGIYSYPVDQFSPEHFKTGNLPFAAGQPHIIFFTLRSDYEDKILVIDWFGEAQNFKQEIAQYTHDSTQNPTTIAPLWQKMQHLGQQVVQIAQTIPELIASGTSLYAAVSQSFPQQFSGTESELSALQKVLLTIQEHIKDINQRIRILLPTQHTVDFRAITQVMNNLLMITKQIESSMIDRTDPKNAIGSTKDAVMFWNVTKQQANENPALWAQNIMKLGIHGVIDQGSSTIHRAEPTQAVFFSIQPIELLKIIDNPTAGRGW